jgi:hypothetical protein
VLVLANFLCLRFYKDVNRKALAPTL